MSLKNKKSLPPATIALSAALLFGASTPAAKLLVGQTDPQLLAGLLYSGSGVGLLAVSWFSKTFKRSGGESNLKLPDMPWLAGAVIFGGVIAPLLLMLGLRTTTGGAASLLLNLEAVFTAILAWFVFKENFDRRIFFGMLSIILGSLLLSWQPSTDTAISLGSLEIIGGCFCWALDNNLTRNISDADPVQIAAAKGLVAGLVNCLLAVAGGAHFPSWPCVASAAIVGFLGYGVSLVLFIKGLRLLGTSRTGAYFSTAPFAGAFISLVVLHDQVSLNFVAAAGFMALGVWLHLTEHHTHEHSHIGDAHEHTHTHDEHHQHDHDPNVSPIQPHSHWHVHQPITHSHPHYPDTWHRHDH